MEIRFNPGEEQQFRDVIDSVKPHLESQPKSEQTVPELETYLGGFQVISHANGSAKRITFQPNKFQLYMMDILKSSHIQDYSVLNTRQTGLSTLMTVYASYVLDHISDMKLLYVVANKNTMENYIPKTTRRFENITRDDPYASCTEVIDMGNLRGFNLEWLKEAHSTQVSRLDRGVLGIKNFRTNSELEVHVGNSPDFEYNIRGKSFNFVWVDSCGSISNSKMDHLSIPLATADKTIASSHGCSTSSFFYNYFRESTMRLKYIDEHIVDTMRQQRAPERVLRTEGLCQFETPEGDFVKG